MPWSAPMATLHVCKESDLCSPTRNSYTNASLSLKRHFSTPIALHRAMSTLCSKQTLSTAEQAQQRSRWNHHPAAVVRMAHQIMVLKEPQRVNTADIAARCSERQTPRVTNGRAPLGWLWRVCLLAKIMRMRGPKGTTNGPDRMQHLLYWYVMLILTYLNDRLTQQLGNKAPSPVDTASDRQKTIERLRSIVSILPSREQTRKQAERFWSSSTWYQHLLRRPEFDAIYEPAVYAPTPSNPLTPHKLACVLMVLTLDTYLDLTGPEDNPLVAEYWEGVQKCFDTRFGWAASVAGVQALGLAVFFVGFGWRGVGASNFYWLRLMTSAVQQVGSVSD